MSNKSYSELTRLKTIEERFDYLKMPGKVGEETFGHDRYLNQMFYKSKKWLNKRDEIIARDGGYEFGLKEEGNEIPDGEPIIVHHINPITAEDIENDDPKLYDNENLISMTLNRHNDLHYRNQLSIPLKLVERKPGDTCLWGRRKND